MLLLFLIITFEIQGQNKRTIDSLLSVSNTSTPDSNTVFNYIDIAWEYNGIVPAKSDSFARVAFNLATRINFMPGIAMSLYSLGENYYKQCNYTLALTYLFKSADFFEELGDNRRLGIVYTTIGSVFTDTKNLDKALDYNLKALFYKKQGGSKKSIALSYMNIGNVYHEKQEYNMALQYYFTSKKIVEEINDLRTLAQLYNNFGIIYRIQGKYKESLESYLKSLEIKKKAGSQRGLSVTYYNIGLLNNFLKKPADALQNFQFSLEYAEKVNSIEDIKNAYKGLSDSYAGIGDYRKAFENFQKFNVLSDSIYNIKNLEQFAEMQTKYETRKKEKEIEILTQEKQIQQYQTQQTIIIIISISTFFVLLLIIIMVTLNYRRQKRNRREIIRQIIETEEKERGHFAEDLHDGLGPLLSSISLYVNELSNEQLEKAKKEKITGVACELIDDAIASAKIIANNLTPGMLRDYGLLPAIESFCKKVNATLTLDISIDDKTGKKRYHNIIETTLYRVGLEMINNTVKYARAHSIRISLSEKNNILYFIYHDDGQGFDIEIKKNDIGKGLGLSNILNRINSINGKCEIISSPGKGFQAFLEIPLKY
jgi:two-component system, NarL family, sensor kinase